MADTSTIISLVVSALVGIAVDIGLVVLLGMFAAGIGGRAHEDSPAPRRRPSVVFGTIALAIGAYLGVSYAWQLSYDSGGLGALLGTGITALLVIGGAIHLGLIGVVALAVRRRRESTATRSLFAGAGGLILGALAGIVLAAPLGLTYRAPVFTERAARLDLSWYGEATFVPSAGSPATCTSVADGSEIAHVRGLSAGRLAEANVTVTIDLPASGLEMTMLDIILTLTLPDGTQPGWWSGPVAIADLGPDGGHGHLTFSDLPLVGNGKGGSPSSMVESISGEVTWDCSDAATGGDAQVGSKELADRAPRKPVEKRDRRWHLVWGEPPASELEDLGLVDRAPVDQDDDRRHDQASEVLLPKAGR